MCSKRHASSCAAGARAAGPGEGRGATHANISFEAPGFNTLFIPHAVGTGYVGPSQGRGNICNHQSLHFFCKPSNLIVLRPKQPFAVQLALVLRGLAKGAVPPLPFVGVTCVATATLLIGWRTAFAALTKVGWNRVRSWICPASVTKGVCGTPLQLLCFSYPYQLGVAVPLLMRCLLLPSAGHRLLQRLTPKVLKPETRTTLPDLHMTDDIRTDGRNRLLRRTRGSRRATDRAGRSSFCACWARSQSGGDGEGDGPKERLVGEGCCTFDIHCLLCVCA